MPVNAFIAGAAQHSYRNGAPHPAAAMAHACRLALKDAGVALSEVELLASVEPFCWTYEDINRAVASELGPELHAHVEHLWVPAGGTSPQDLLHQVCARIDAGELQCALICGAESMHTRRRATQGMPEDWPPKAEGVDPMRGQAPFSSEVERKHGLRAPIQLFPLFENAIRAAHQRTEEEQSDVAAQLLAKNAAVAANNPHAWFQDAPSAKEIGTVTAGNRMIVFPYTKRMNAIMDVDQCAAILVCSRSFLERTNRFSQSAAVLGGCGVEEVWNPLERQTFAQCHAMQRAIQLTLQRAGITAEMLDGMDLYSCFPSAVEFGLDALGTTADDPRPVSLTGGLAFAGGPGNAYVLHSLAAAYEAIRREPDKKLLVTGIGMANTKHAATALTGAATVPDTANGATSYREPLDEKPIPVETHARGTATIVSWTIEYQRDGAPANVIVLLDLEDGQRTIANMADLATSAAALRAQDPVGRTGTVKYDPNQDRNFFTLSA